MTKMTKTTKTRLLIIIAVMLCMLCMGLYSCTNITYRDFGVNDVGNIVGFMIMGTKSDETNESDENTAEADNLADNTEDIMDFTESADSIAPENSAENTEPTEPPETVAEIITTSTPEETPPAPQTNNANNEDNADNRENTSPEFIRLSDVFPDVPERFNSFSFPTSLQVTDIFKQNMRNLDGFLTKDFDEALFYVLTTEPKYFTPSDFGGGTLSDARLYRTHLVRTTYNISKVGAMSISGETLAADIEQRINAGEYIADIVCVPLDIQSRLIQKGLLINLKKIPFLNLNAEYYNRSAAEAYAINNNVYGVVSDITFEPANIYTMFYNRSLVQQYNLPNPVEFYNNNAWTYDNMFSMVKSLTAAVSDLNNSAGTEVYGIGFNKENNDIINGLFMSSGNKFFAKRDYNYPYMNFNNEKSLKIITALTNLFAPQSESGMANYLYEGDENQRTAFESGNILFSIATLDILPDITDINFEWGILPPPTLNGEQLTNSNKQISFNSSDAMCISVLKGTQNTEISGVMTEAMAMMSHNYSKELYIQEQMLYNLRDVDSVNILNDILYNETYNHYSTFSTVDAIYNATIGTLKNAANRTGEFVDLYDRNRAALYEFFGTAKYFERN